MLISIMQRERMDELKAKAEEVEAEVKVLKKEAARQLASGGELKNTVAANEAAVEELRTKHADILEAAQMQQACLSCSLLYSLRHFASICSFCSGMLFTMCSGRSPAFQRTAAVRYLGTPLKV